MGRKRSPAAHTSQLGESLERDLEEFGLNGYEARVLVALASAGTADATELGRLSGVNRTSVYPVLQELTAQGLAEHLPGKTARWASLPAEELLERLYERHEQRLQSLRDRKQHTERSLRRLMAQSASDQVPYVHFLRGAAQVKRRYDALLAGAQAEVLVFNLPPYTWAAGRPNPAVFEAIDRGVQFKVMYQSAEFRAPEAEATRQELDAYHAAGVQGRVVDTLPSKLMVADRCVALIAIPDPALAEDAYPTTLHIEHPGFVSMQADSFDCRWATGRPYQEH